ncbi:MAG TPA: sigma-70 family RNA polymerase sigma factor [Dyadobacter sp.]|jgi:RNA polymerase sigma-70 factor (ECF subfamily)|nr:sigma-70 family RNA polymerase sigma factor [Dyadobacter sp.]
MRKVTYTESELIVQLKGNNRDAYEYLYDRYSPALYGIILKVIKDEEKAADSMQDTFLKIWKNISRYDPEKGTLFTWVLNVARNTAIDKLRMDVKTDKVVSLSTVTDSEVATVATYIPPINLIDLRAIVSRLLPERRVLIEMVYFDGYTHEEAAETLQVPLGTVKSRIRKSLQELRYVFGTDTLLSIAG